LAESIVCDGPNGTKARFERTDAKNYLAIIDAELLTSAFPEWDRESENSLLYIKRKSNTRISLLSSSDGNMTVELRLPTQALKPHGIAGNFNAKLDAYYNDILEQEEHSTLDCHLED